MLSKWLSPFANFDQFNIIVKMAVYSPPSSSDEGLFGHQLHSTLC